MLSPDKKWLAEKIAMLAIIAPLLFYITVALGRFLKRGAGVHLGTMYRLFCIAISIYLPLKILKLDYPADFSNSKGGWFDLQRELLSASILLGSIFVIALIRRYLWEGHFREKRHTEIPKFLQEVAALIVFMAAVMIVLSGIYGEGKALAGLLAGSGVVAIILGFAMQDMLGNIISGIALEIGKPFKRRDWLVYEGQRAEVVEVNWRSTLLRTNDHVFLDIPNSQIARHIVQNLSHTDRSHAERIIVGIEYGAAPNLVKEILVRAATNGLHVLQKPAPKAYLKEFGESAINYEVKFWIDRDESYNDIMDSIRTNIWYEMNRNNITIPYPVRTVQIERNRRKSQEVPATLMERLRNQKFFQCLSAPECEQLLASANVLRYGRGEKIIHQGAEGRSMFVLMSGSADVHVAQDGESNYVATLKAGDYFGEMSLLTGETRSATVIAGQDCELLKISKFAFSEVLMSNQTLFGKLSEMLAQRRLEMEGVLASSASHHAMATRQEEYAANFLSRISSFFRL